MSRALMMLMAAAFLACPSEKPAATPTAPTTPTAAPAPVSPAEPAIIEELGAAEVAALEPPESPCSKPVVVYAGSGVFIAEEGYLHLVPKDDDYVDAPVAALDQVVDRRRNVPFTLSYPFEKPFTGTVQGPLTRRNAIDAIRRGFRAMYKEATVKDIPGMMNKDVAGKYGRSFHAIEDLAIERMTLCAEGHLDIDIGS